MLDAKIRNMNLWDRIQNLLTDALLVHGEGQRSQKDKSKTLHSVWTAAWSSVSTVFSTGSGRIKTSKSSVTAKQSLHSFCFIQYSRILLLVSQNWATGLFFATHFCARRKHKIVVDVELLSASTILC